MYSKSPEAPSLQTNLRQGLGRCYHKFTLPSELISVSLCPGFILTQADPMEGQVAASSSELFFFIFQSRDRELLTLTVQGKS